MLLLVPGVLLGVMAIAAEKTATAVNAVPAKEVKPSSGVQAKVFENVGRQELLFRSNELVNAANKNMLAGKYRDAISGYRQVVALLEPVSSGNKFRNKIDFCRKRISQCYYEMAGNAMKIADERATSNDFEEAIKLCKEAVDYCEERREELDRRIAFYEKRRLAAINRENSAIEKIAPEFSSQEYEIELLIEQGVSLYKKGEYTAAKHKFEEALLIDPYCEAAIQNLHGINNHIAEKAKARFAATARHMMGSVDWNAAIPIVKNNAPEDVSSSVISGSVVKEKHSEMENTLKSIIFPSYTLINNLWTFEQTMEDLRRQAEEHDTKRRGVNFVIRYAKHPDPKKAPKLANYTTARPTSLYDILSRLQERGDLTFKIDDNAVVVAEKGEALEKMTVKVFSYTLRPGESEEGLKNVLKSGANVTFAPGSSLTLVTDRNEVVSKNTPINQQRIENWIAKNDGGSGDMVQIMFKFLEVSQNDLDELGFNWQYARLNEDRSAKWSLGGNPLLRHYVNSDANDRFGGSAAGSTMDTDFTTTNALVDNDATYNLSWTDKKNIIGASVYALDWANSSDILYSPRVTTLDNTLAHVDMRETHHYPEEYEDIDGEDTDRASFSVVVPQPSLDEETQLGISFDITPKIQGKLIQARVEFSIDQFDTWMIVDSRDLNDPDSDGEYQKKAVLNNRVLRTDVTLKDGETVLIGSISQDLTNLIHDKIPILGDLPLIGRLFQSKYTLSKKNNLLVFMTCRIILPDGSAKYKDPKTGGAENGGYLKGLPEFSRNL